MNCKKCNSEIQSQDIIISEIEEADLEKKSIEVNAECYQCGAVHYTYLKIEDFLIETD